MTKNTPPAVQDPNLAAYIQNNTFEDEINLVDLWLVLVKRKNVLMGVTILCLIAGLSYAFFVPPKYQYSTSIEIGTQLTDGKLTVVESPETVLAKVQESYIPIVRQEYLVAHPELKSVAVVEARVPKDSQIVVITSEGPEEEAEMHKVLQQAIVDRMKKDHGRNIDVLRKEAEVLQHQAVAKLEELKDAEQLILSREGRLSDISEILRKRLTEVQDDLKQTKENRLKATREVKTESRAMTLLMLDSEIRQSREMLAQIDERLNIKVAEEKDLIKKNLADNKRAQATQEDNIAKLNIQLANLSETRSLLPPLRSPEPVSPSKVMVILISLILGLMFGVLIAFFTEFLSKVPRQADT